MFYFEKKPTSEKLPGTATSSKCAGTPPPVLKKVLKESLNAGGREMSCQELQIGLAEGWMYIGCGGYHAFKAMVCVLCDRRQMFVYASRRVLALRWTSVMHYVPFSCAGVTQSHIFPQLPGSSPILFNSIYFNNNQQYIIYYNYILFNTITIYYYYFNSNNIFNNNNHHHQFQFNSILSVTPLPW